MARLSLRVTTYSGYKADERPTAFFLGDRAFEVREVVDSWFGEKSTSFKVVADDGNIYILRHDKTADRWELVFFEVAGFRANEREADPKKREPRGLP